MGSTLGSGRRWIPQGELSRSRRLVLFVILLDKKNQRPTPYRDGRHGGWVAERREKQKEPASSGHQYSKRGD